MANLGEEFKSSGVTAKTPDNILLGAGTIHKGLKFEGGAWNFAESLLGATSGGTKFTIKPELQDLEIDGVLVKTVGLTVKQGETAVIETNIVEITPEILKLAIVGKDGEASDKAGYSEIVSKRQIEEGDYIENFGYVGKTIAGKPIIIVFDKALCTSGVELEGKNKEAGVFKGTFECCASLAGDHETLPYHIYYPTAAAEPAAEPAAEE